MKVTYDLKQINNCSFEVICEPSPGHADKPLSLYRLSPEDRKGMPADNADIDALRRKLSAYFHEKLGNNAWLEAKCNIKPDTFHKVMKFKHGRNVTYRFLAKFAVGAGLSVSETLELYNLWGSPLNPDRNRYDYILLCELKNHSDIDEYHQDLISLGYNGIITTPDDI